MKKLWAGISILAVLLCIGFGVAMIMGHIHGNLAHRLEEAAGQCLTDWGQANSLADSARASWEQHHHWVAALVDHEPLEEIESLFSQLALSQRNRDTEEFAALEAENLTPDKLLASLEAIGL